MKTKLITQRSMVILFVMLLTASQINGQFILPGTDAFSTPPSGTYIDFTPPIPPGFFGPGSDPFTGTVAYAGEPLGTTPFGTFSSADTYVRRFGDPFDRPTCPAPPSDIPIEIIALHLSSVNPITVTYNGGQNPEQWNIEVGLSGIVPQQQGVMSVTKSHQNGGTFNSILPVTPILIFSQVIGAQTVTLDPGPTFQFTSTNSPWVYGCPSCASFTIPPGVFVDHDLNGTMTVPVPPSSNFYPGISSNGTCNTTGTYSNGSITMQAQAPTAQHTVNSPVNLSAPIPTLSQWGLIILGVLFALGGFVMMRKNA